MPKKSNDIQPWERQKNESTQAFQAFATYRDMGTERSVRAVARQLNKSCTLIGSWSSRWNWVERVHAYDDYIDAEARKASIKKYRDMNARHISIALQLQQKALMAMQKMPDKALAPKDVISFIDKAMEIERMTRKEELNIYGDKKEQESLGLADTIMRAYKKRKEASTDDIE